MKANKLLVIFLITLIVTAGCSNDKVIEHSPQPRLSGSDTIYTNPPGASSPFIDVFCYSPDSFSVQRFDDSTMVGGLLNTGIFYLDLELMSGNFNNFNPDSVNLYIASSSFHPDSSNWFSEYLGLELTRNDSLEDNYTHYSSEQIYLNQINRSYYFRLVVGEMLDVRVHEVDTTSEGTYFISFSYDYYVF